MYLSMFGVHNTWNITIGIHNNSPYQKVVYFKFILLSILK